MPDGAQDFAYTTTGTGGRTPSRAASASTTTRTPRSRPAAVHLHRRRCPAPRRSPRRCRSPAGRSTDLVCTGTGATTRPLRHRRRDASPSTPGEAVTCTYTNTQRGTITVIKDTVPDAAQDFAYTTPALAAGALAAGFSLDDDADATPRPAAHLHLHRHRRARHLQGHRDAGGDRLDLTNLVCIDGGTDSSTSPPASPASPSAPATRSPAPTPTPRRVDHGHQGRRARRRPGLRLHDDRHRRRDALRGRHFTLDDDAATGTANTLTFTFTGADATGTKTIQETLPVTGWTPDQPGLLEGHDHPRHRPRQHRPGAR